MKPRFLANENIPRALVEGLQRRVDGVDIVRVQDVGLRTMDDPTIQQWAADNGRLLVTQDVRTMPDLAYQRVAAGQEMPGVFVAAEAMPVGVTIDELATIAGASDAGEWAGRVICLPLR